MIFELIYDIVKLFVYFRIFRFELIDRLRRSDARHDVFPLCVHQIFPVQLFLTRCRVSGKRNARTGRIAHVSEYHHLYVYCRAPAGGDVVHPSVIDRTGVVPRTENGFDCAH